MQYGADLDLRTLGVVMEKNGQPVAIGAGAAVLGHPAAAIAMLPTATRWLEIRPSSVVMTRSSSARRDTS